MTNRGELIFFEKLGWHKGFYNDGNAKDSLRKIAYTDFFKEEPDDEDFAYGDAESLLCGSCQIFALSLSKILGYAPYIIKSKDAEHFHAFCQFSKDHQIYYVDARGITTSFDEFMEVAGVFAPGEFVIREITSHDIDEWNQDEKYLNEALAFAEAIIKGNIECYRV